VKNSLKVLIFWEGFPACGLLIKEMLYHYDDVVVVATKASVPFKGLEEMLGHNVLWLEHPNDISQYKEKLSDRNFVLHTGWIYKSWLQLDYFLKKKNLAKIVVVVDNNYKKNARQFFGAFYFRFFLRKYFDAAFVPGRSAFKLMLFLGMAHEDIYIGNYGASEEIFYDAKNIIERNDEFLYVGQLNKRKSIDILLEGYSIYQSQGGTWQLRLLGNGPLLEECKLNSSIICEGFTQPHLVANIMNQAKVLVLISREDHWGTVVCEGAACGMHLLLSKGVGSAEDLLRSGVNGIQLPKLSSYEMAKALHYYEKLSNDLLLNGSIVSKGIAKGYDSSAYLSVFKKMVFDIFDK
jgi:glycosyltransferase involved in cell wall biosynthesis